MYIDIYIYTFFVCIILHFVHSLLFNAGTIIQCAKSTYDFFLNCTFGSIFRLLVSTKIIPLTGQNDILFLTLFYDG